MIKLAAIGVGNRTGKYLTYFMQHPEEVELVAFAEPNLIRREACRKQFSLSQAVCFASSEELFDNYQGPCDGIIIGSPDRYHYAQVMQADFTRDSVTPLDTSKELKFVINGYDAKVSSLAYEIRTSDGMKVLENRKIKNLGEEDGYLTASVTVNSSLRVNQEYSMQHLFFQRL